jgi:hypothetical protein
MGPFQNRVFGRKAHNLLSRDPKSTIFAIFPNDLPISPPHGSRLRATKCDTYARAREAAGAERVPGQCSPCA